MRQLKLEIKRCDKLLSKYLYTANWLRFLIVSRFVFHFLVNWKTPALPRNLNSFMADMSLKPEVEATLIGDVASTFKESHEFMITELRNLLNDKVRMLLSK